jgi:hypothetical protein
MGELKMLEIDDRLIADFACLDPTYVEDLGGVLNLGTTFAMLFHRWSPTSSSTFEKSAAVHLILPKTSILVRDGGFIASSLRLQQAPVPQGISSEYRMN